MQDTVIVIPVRVAAVRLPNKPLALIDDVPMVIHTARRAIESNIGEVIIACCGDEIYEVAEKYGIRAIKTDAELCSGTDRVNAAVSSVVDDYRFVINLQGDMPFIDPIIIVKIKELLEHPHVDIATAVAPLIDLEKMDNPNVVKAILTQDNRALYFTRAKAPFGQGTLYEHIGIYGYSIDVLTQFVQYEQTELEKRERLEQLRALEHDMKIYASIVTEAPVSVDTPEDLDTVRKLHS